MTDTSFIYFRVINENIMKFSVSKIKNIPIILNWNLNKHCVIKIVIFYKKNELHGYNTVIFLVWRYDISGRVHISCSGILLVHMNLTIWHLQQYNHFPTRIKGYWCLRDQHKTRRTYDAEKWCRNTWLHIFSTFFTQMISYHIQWA